MSENNEMNKSSKYHRIYKRGIINIVVSTIDVALTIGVEVAADRLAS